MTGEQLKAVLHDGGRVFGTMVSLTRSPRWARVLGRLGFDYVIVDTEHSPFSRGEVADMVAMLERVGVVPIVRVPTPDAHYVTMAMDAGAQGVLAPYCETAEQVRGVIGGAKWRPLKGALLDRAVDTGEFPSEETRDYLARANRNSIAIIGIESVPAIQNLDAILAVPGVDAVFVGPHDLSISVGVPEQYHHPAFEAAVDRILTTCSAHNVPVAIHLHNIQAATRWMKAGVRFVLHYSDTRAMAEGYRVELDALRQFDAELSGKAAAATEAANEIL
jgi:2-keto-3-deoxy-L-rhamnonate aldolase RhmA